jgi:uncharacterized cupredoxin-like copper-binding protein
MRRRALLRLVATMAALVLALLVGCGGGGGQPQQEEAAEQRERNPQPQQEAAGQGVVKTIQIEEVEYELNPAKVTLEEPDTYVFVAKNTGQVVHALEIEGQGIEKETENIQPGQTAKLNVDLKRGTYVLYCPVDGHKQRGMDGQIKVAVQGGGGKGGDSGGSGGATDAPPAHGPLTRPTPGE